MFTPANPYAVGASSFDLIAYQKLILFVETNEAHLKHNASRMGSASYGISHF